MLPTGTSGSGVLTGRSSSKRCVAIINSAAGNGISGRLWHNCAEQLVQHLSSNGFAVEQRFTAGPGSAVQLAAEAAAAGVDVILAVGGDGTIHEVICGLVPQTQKQQQQEQPTTALAVLPLGTASDYARTFGWRANDATAACQRITNGEQQPTDVSVLRQIGSHTQAAAGAAAGASAAEAAAAAAGAGPRAAVRNAGSPGNQCQYFVNVASCGAGALATAQAASLKQLGPLCYPVSSVLALLRWKGCTLQVCMDGSEDWRTLDNLTALVLGHGQFWGGGYQILPQADPTDGLMDVVALQGLGLSDFIRKGRLMRSGQHVQVKGVNMLGRCRKIKVKAAEQGTALPWECDGEAEGQIQAAEIGVLQGALRLLTHKHRGSKDR